MVAGAAYSKMVDKAKSWTYHFDLDAKKKAKVKFFSGKGNEALGKVLRLI